MSQKVNVRSMRQANRQLVLSAIRDRPLTSRTEIAKFTALAKPTVGDIVEELLGEGLVEEAGTDEGTPGVGRRARLLRFNNLSSAHLGVHIDSRATQVAVADALGKTRCTMEFATLGRDPESMIDELVPLIKRAIRKVRVPMSKVKGVGVTLPGIIDQRTGSCVLAPNLGWKDFPLRQELEQRLSKPIAVQNIKDAGAAAEGHLGAARGVRNFLWLYVGTGVGAGVVIDGRAFLGSAGFGGEIGHCRVVEDGGVLCRCGRRGCLETVASGLAIADWARERLQSEESCLAALPVGFSGRDVSHAARQGDSLSIRAVEEAGKSLGVGLSYMANLFNPELIVLGGSVAEAGQVLVSSVESSFQQFVLEATRVPIVQSELLESGLLSGAILLAMSHAEAVALASAEGQL